MAKPYDPKTMSLKKLGATGAVPVLPTMPVGCQIRLTPLGIKAHYKMDGEGHYVNGPLPSFPPSRLLSIKTAVEQAPGEQSYSDTGQTYKQLIVKPDPEHADRFLIKAGAVLIGFGIVDPAMELVSSDESIAEQAGIGGDDDGDSEQDED